MKKLTLVLFLAGMLLITPLTAQEKDVRASFKMPRSLLQAPEAMMIYKTLTPVVGEKDLQSMMKATGMQGKITERDRNWIAREGKKVLEIFKQPGTGYLRFSNDLKLGAEKASENLPSKKDAMRKAKAFLKENGLMKENMFLAGVDYFEFMHRDEKGNVVTGKSAVKVAFGFKLDGVLAEGPGAKAGVVFGEGGEIIGVSYIWRNTKPLKKIKIISPRQALVNFKHRWPGEGNAEQLKNADILTLVNIKDIRLSYYLGPGCTPQEQIKPVYVFEGDFIVTRKTMKKPPKTGEQFVIILSAIPGEKDFR